MPLLSFLDDFLKQLRIIKLVYWDFLNVVKLSFRDEENN